MDPIPQLLINLVLRYEPNAIKKNTFQYVKYFIHLMEGHLSFISGKHGLMILDKDGNLFPYLKFIKFLQLDLKEMFDTFRNNKNPQISSSQWNEYYNKLYDKASSVIPANEQHGSVKELMDSGVVVHVVCPHCGARSRAGPSVVFLCTRCDRLMRVNSKGMPHAVKSLIKSSIQKQKDIIIDECIQEIKNHPNTTWEIQLYTYGVPAFKDNWNIIGWVFNRTNGVISSQNPSELYSKVHKNFQWMADEKITEEVKEIESKYKQKINQMKSSMEEKDFHPDKVYYIIPYMEYILFNGESEMDNTFSQGTHKNGYVRKIKGGLEGEFNYKFNKLESIDKFLKEIEMYLK